MLGVPVPRPTQRSVLECLTKARLGQAMPDYDRREEDLRRMGPRLEW